MALSNQHYMKYVPKAIAEYNDRRAKLVAVGIPPWKKLSMKEREEWVEYMHNKEPVLSGVWDKPESENNVTLEMHNDLANTLEQLIAEITSRVEQLEEAAKPVVMELSGNTSEVQDAINETLDEVKKVASENEALKGELENAKDRSNVLSGWNAGNLKTIENLRKNVEILDNANRQLTEELKAERNKPKPYAISRNDYEKLTRSRREQWYTKILFIRYDFTNMPVVYMTNQQLLRVQGLAQFTKL